MTTRVLKYTIKHTHTYISGGLLSVHVVHGSGNESGGVSMATVRLWKLTPELRLEETKSPPAKTTHTVLKLPLTCTAHQSLHESCNYVGKPRFVTATDNIII